MHRHHKIAKSRGGTNEDWNLVELDPYEHAYEHALDFALFEHSPMFDCRHDAWPLLPEDLREAVRAELSHRMNNRTLSEETRQKMSISHKGKKASASHRESISNALIGHPVSDKHRETARKISLKNFSNTNTLKFKCLVTGKITTSGPLTGYQKARGINPSLREQIYD